jgi:hypothetical protein
MRKKGENNIKPPRRKAAILDEIMISPLASQVKPNCTGHMAMTRSTCTRSAGARNVGWSKNASRSFGLLTFFGGEEGDADESQG